MIDPKQLQALETVARTGTFLRAADELRISQPAISERIRLLEEGMGYPLVVRTNPIAVTEMGQRLISYFHQLKILEDNLLGQDPSSQKHAIRLPVAVNFDSLSSWFIEAAHLAVLENDIQIEITASNENSTLNYLKNGSVLACVSSSPHPLTGCEATYLGTCSYRCVASPKLFKRLRMNPSKITAETLQSLPAMTYGRDDDFHDSFLQSYYGIQQKGGSYIHVPFLSAMKDALLHGWGYGLILESAVLSEIESGRLLDLCRHKSLEIHLYWHSVQLSNSKLAAFSKSLTQNAKKVLRQVPRTNR